MLLLVVAVLLLVPLAACGEAPNQTFAPPANAPQLSFMERPPRNWFASSVPLLAGMPPVVAFPPLAVAQIVLVEAPPFPHLSVTLFACPLPNTTGAPCALLAPLTPGGRLYRADPQRDLFARLSFPVVASGTAVRFSLVPTADDLSRALYLARPRAVNSPFGVYLGYPTPATGVLVLLAWEHRAGTVVALYVGAPGRFALDVLYCADAHTAQACVPLSVNNENELVFAPTRDYKSTEIFVRVWLRDTTDAFATQLFVEEAAIFVREPPPFSSFGIAQVALAIGVPAVAGALAGGALGILVMRRDWSWWRSAVACAVLAIFMWGAALPAAAILLWAARSDKGGGWTLTRRLGVYALLLLQGILSLACGIVFLYAVGDAHSRYTTMAFPGVLSGHLILAVALPLFACSLVCLAVALWLGHAAYTQEAAAAGEGGEYVNFTAFSNLASPILPGGGRAVAEQPRSALYVSVALCVLHLSFSTAAIAMRSFGSPMRVLDGTAVVTIIALQLPTYVLLQVVCGWRKTDWVAQTEFWALVVAYVPLVVLLNMAGAPVVGREVIFILESGNLTAVLVLCILDVFVVCYVALWFASLSVPLASARASARDDAVDALDGEATAMSDYVPQLPPLGRTSSDAVDDDEGPEL